MDWQELHIHPLQPPGAPPIHAIRTATADDGHVIRATHYQESAAGPAGLVVVAVRPGPEHPFRFPTLLELQEAVDESLGAGVCVVLGMVSAGPDGTSYEVDAAEGGVALQVAGRMERIVQAAPGGLVT